jgi:hypothetical protein
MERPEQGPPVMGRLERRWQWSESGFLEKRKILTSGSHKKVYKITQSRYVQALAYHISTDSGVCLSQIVLVGLNRMISAHWNEIAQNQWFFEISLNTGGSKYFQRKCGGFLKFSLVKIATSLARLTPKFYLNKLSLHY